MQIDTPVGTIIRNCNQGRASYILVEAQPETGIPGGLASQCLECSSYMAFRDKNNKLYHPRICNITTCVSRHRTDGKNVCWKLHSTGKLSRSK